MATPMSNSTDETGSGRKVRQHVCPHCKQSFDIPVAPDDKYFPFCSHRCQLVDLGKWLDGEHSISTTFGEEDE